MIPKEIALSLPSNVPPERVIADAENVTKRNLDIGARDILNMARLLLAYEQYRLQHEKSR